MNKLFFFFLICSTAFAQTGQDIQQVAVSFLGTLDEGQKELISYDFEDTLRSNWTNLPVGLAKRPGLGYGSLSDKSRIEFHQLLLTVFSSQGYLKTVSIMSLDDILNDLYQTAFEKNEISEKEYENIKNLDWKFENYFLSIWGQPNDTEPWGLKFGGHHISLNLTVIGEEYAITPLFLGTDPAEVSSGKYAGFRVLSKEEDYGMELINSFSEEQKTKATLSQEVPADILTNPNSSQRIDSYSGISASELTRDQKNTLLKLIHEYVANLESDKAQYFNNKLRNSGLDALYFAWIGAYEGHQPHYYVINGPDFLIEYDNVGFQVNGNHIHTIWREKGNDFGEDILKTHHMNHEH